MKRLILIIALLIASGGFGMINQKHKNNLFRDATSDINTPLKEVEGTFKKSLFEYGWTKEDIIQISLEYVGKYPQAPYPKNLIDFTFREIADRGLNYWGYTPPTVKAGFLDFLPDWAKWLGIGLGFLIIGGIVVRVLPGRK